MKGANEFARLFETGQYGRLYIVSGRHARGLTFRVFVLPEGKDAKPNGGDNPPLNTDAVEVYGVIVGHRGWTESYGWLHEGPWQKDFQVMVDQRKNEIAERKAENQRRREEKEAAKQDRTNELLASY